MKNIIIIFAVAGIMATACTNTSKKTGAVILKDSAGNIIVDSLNAPVIKFEQNSYYFGQINSGEKASHDFEFTNTGKSPLIITSATATCGCTVPDYPKEPIAPGEDGKISVVFNSEGKEGMQNKVITITANTVPATTEVHLLGDVKPLKKAK